MKGLHFDIDASQLNAVAAELGASEKQVKLAFSAASRRTVTTLRTMSARGLASELQLRTIGLLRRRLKAMRLRSNGDGVQLWYGLNDMPASWFKGRARQDASGASKHGQHFEKGFVARSKFKGRDTVFKRKGKGRLHIEEQNIKVEDEAVVFVEDEIFSELEPIFWKNFTRELTARVKYKIGDA